MISYRYYTLSPLESKDGDRDFLSTYPRFPGKIHGISGPIRPFRF